MSQTLCIQLASIASMDISRWQYSLGQLLQSHLSSAKRSCNRCVFLSPQGWQKSTQARVYTTNLVNVIPTYECLSERSLLDKRTVNQLLSCEVRVDKTTLKTFFGAFNLALEINDYISSQNDRANDVKPDASIHSTLTLQTVKLEQLVEELGQLKQCIRGHDQLFHQLEPKESHMSQQLGA